MAHPGDLAERSGPSVNGFRPSYGERFTTADCTLERSMSPKRASIIVLPSGLGHLDSLTVGTDTVGSASQLVVGAVDIEVETLIRIEGSPRAGLRALGH